MDDLISRQAAIERIKVDLFPSINMAKHIEIILNGVPSAEKHGRWVIKDNPGTGWYRVTCSECGEDVTSVIPMIGFFPNAKALWDFCPDCGADMREGEES